MPSRFSVQILFAKGGRGRIDFVSRLLLLRPGAAWARGLGESSSLSSEGGARFGHTGEEAAAAARCGARRRGTFSTKISSPDRAEARNPEDMLLGEISKDLLTRPLTRNEVFTVLLRLTIFGAATYFSIKWVSDALDPTRKQRTQLKKKAECLLKQIGVEGVKLSEHEMNIAALLVDPKDIKVTWKDIAGLDEVVSELRDTVILPFQWRHLFHHSRLCQPPRGVLLYGPPGCGKTLLAKATAQASGCRFINLQASTLTDKWYGESQKLTAAVFSLASKIQPCIIFIDEIDAFLRNRSDADHEATAMMKAEFMSLWDGLETEPNCQTQRQRQDILRLILAGENMSNAVNLKELAEKTGGYSGSDLRELCRDAATYRVRDYVRKQQMKQIAWMFQEEDSDSDEEEKRLRPLTQLDLLIALEKMRESKGASTATPALKEPALD
ncbi:outer mitochondrial transmembrane helix translocase-like isoform X2 [Hemicordylus capensis]|uniref:outer mitochondrial transmembrane helix translocase-like isoform X2 n=1 Tax=Hemicordylus capensis TaxID=884348 RepID=UPI002303259E|nr:outer mitochondrial transmembrane helix translocase-like isoform X2 [Hemicordylus capensis]